VVLLLFDTIERQITAVNLNIEIKENGFFKK
jgi:hypothetical protein